MKFTQLNPHLLRYEKRPDGVYHVEVDTIAECNGVQFLCPKCFETNKGAVGTHSVLCWSQNRGTPDEAAPGPGRWTITGTSVEDLTLGGENGKSDSVLLTSGCGWHGWVKNGEVTSL